MSVKLLAEILFKFQWQIEKLCPDIEPELAFNYL